MIFGRFFQFSAKFPKSIISLQKSCRKCGKMILSRKINVWFKFILKSFYSLREVTFELKKGWRVFQNCLKTFPKVFRRVFQAKSKGFLKGEKRWKSVVFLSFFLSFFLCFFFMFFFMTNCIHIEIRLPTDISMKFYFGNF